MRVTLSGMLTVVKLVQPRNASLPILVTPSPIETLVRLLQYANAKSMLVTLSGIVMLVRVVQCLNANGPMRLTPSGIAYFVALPQGHWISVFLFLS